MAWNDDGKKGGDPWDGQSPPNLDEALRKLQQRFKRIFGGSGGGSSGGGGRLFRISPVSLVGILVVVVLVYAAFGVYQVDQQERGVVFRFGKAQSELKEPGLRWNWPFIDVVEKVNVTRVNSSEHSGTMLTEDENIVEINLVVQYVISDPVKNLIEIREPEKSLKHATESALRHVVGSSTMDSVITEGREILGEEVEQRLQTYLNRYQTGFLISKVNLDSVGPPAEVQAAFDDVQKAKEDEVKFINEATAYAEQIVPKARGEAQQAIESANAYRDQTIARSEGEADRFTKLLKEYQLAKDVTRDRLYIGAIESVLSKSGKVLVDIEGGNNILYLPLDQLRGQSSSTRDSNSSVPATQSSVDRATDAILRRLQENIQAHRR